MRGIGRFKLTDALPDQKTGGELLAAELAGPTGTSARRAKARRRAVDAKDKSSLGGSASAEQVREARESKQAKNAEASTRDRMVEIGRGNQQAGRQRAK
jgi:hypothetical protein